MGKSEMQRKIQRKKLNEEEKMFAEDLETLIEVAMEEEKIFAEDLERLIEVAMEEDGRKVQELEAERADEMVWLMKCPPRVDKAWREISASSSSFSSEFVLVAKYSESVDLLLPDLSPELSMEMVSPELWNISKLYSVNKSKDFVGPVSIFSESNQGEAALEGTITHKLDIRPHCGIEEYGKLLREGNMKPVAGNRRIQVDRRGEYLMPKPALVRKKVKRCERRWRSDRTKVEAKMFELFERQPKWTARQLLQETNQPEQFVREILKELCVYNARSGFTYELKPEYKITGKDNTCASLSKEASSGYFVKRNQKNKRSCKKLELFVLNR